MKKCNINCILDPQSFVFFYKNNLLDLQTLSVTEFCQSMVNKSYLCQGVAFLLVKIVERLTDSERVVVRKKFLAIFGFIFYDPINEAYFWNLGIYMLYSSML